MGKPVILCVDDEKIILISLKEQLRRNFGDKYNIETVESGEEALELIEEIEEEDTDLPIAIVDQIMPGIKGDELLKQIHTRMPRTLKVLLTGQADAEAVGKAVNYASLYRYIAKPWEETDLTLTVTEAVRSYFQDKKLEEQNKILQRLNRELEEFNATLEQQVQERTAQLEAQKVELKQKSEQLAELNVSKDKFFSIISHDLRSPFNALLGFAQILSENVESFSLNEIKQKTEKIQTSAERLYALLENLLTWSRIQRGVIEYYPEEIDLFEIAEDNIDLFTPNAEHKNITLRNLVREATSVYADYSMINTVIRNLTSNALKFTSTGDSVTLAANDQEKQYVEVAVSDTGVGIPQDIIPKLLRIDTQHTNEGTAGEKGTGLGLILCRELVEKNGGKIWVESEVGKGTTFRFTLPKEAMD